MSQQGTADTPFVLLLNMEKAIRVLFSKTPTQITVKSDWMGLAFLSGEQILLTPLEEVIGILPVDTFAYIPGVKPWLLGMATYRDDIFPVTDLAAFVGQKKSTFSKHSRLLVVASLGEKAGLLVNRVMGLQRVTEEQTRSKNLIPENSIYEPFVMGAWLNANVALPIISCQSIIKHPKFRDVLAKTEVSNGLY